MSAETLKREYPLPKPSAIFLPRTDYVEGYYDCEELGLACCCYGSGEFGFKISLPEPILKAQESPVSIVQIWPAFIWVTRDLRKWKQVKRVRSELRRRHVKSVEAFVHITLTANNTFLTVSRTKKRDLPLVSKHLGHLEGVKNARKRAYHYSYFLGAGVAKYLKHRRLKVVNFIISGAARYKRAAIINSFRKFGLQIGSFVTKTRRPFNGCPFKRVRRK